MHLEHCILGASDDSAAKTVMMSSVHWCPAMRLILASRRGSYRFRSGPMQESAAVTAIDHHGCHSMLGTHTLDEYMVSDLFICQGEVYR